jgi:molybdate transport system substrate-binding protein
MSKDTTSLLDALMASDAFFVPYTKVSTAGLHVAKVLAQLGIANAVAGRLNIHPNGATAMKHLAASGAKQPVGCTQTTEIISTPGVALSGSLPPGCELSTMYMAGVTTRAAHAAQALEMIELLISTDHDELRQRAGFVSASR